MSIWLIKNNTWKDTYYAGVDHKPTMWGDRLEAVEFYSFDVAHVIFSIYALGSAGCELIRTEPRRVPQSCDVCGGELERCFNRSVCGKCGESYHRGT